ncbi:MAG TPA: signal peptidase I [Bryobacteraceae bacterium]|nr:signal peptidase I [Bryobacteraceae bacterium]
MSDTPQIAEQVLETPVATASKSSPRHEGILGSLQWLAGTVVIAIFAITFALQAFQIPSPSMENTLMVGDYLLVDKVHFAPEGFWSKIEPYSPITRGDIIVFRYPLHPQEHFVKRVIGVPGDRIRIADKQLFVNGLLAQEPYVVHRIIRGNDFRINFPNLQYPDAEANPNWLRRMHRLVENGELIVPPGQYFVLGDNRDNSEDSRYWGFVPRENIIGRPLLIYWSLRELDRIDGMPPANEGPSARLSHFAYTVTHLRQLTRWDRTFRLVR